MRDPLISLGIPTELSVRQLQRQMNGVCALVAVPGANSRRRLQLVLVHELLRRYLEVAARPPDGRPPHFDRERWDQRDPARLAAYEALIELVRERTVAAVPVGARVAVVSRGDDRLLQLEGRAGVHFPQQRDGSYAGFYPRDADDAIAQLHALRSDGIQFVVFPATAFWWLDFYPALARWLTPSAVWACGDCSVFELPQLVEGEERTV